MKKNFIVFVIAAVGGITSLGINRLIENKNAATVVPNTPVQFVNMPPSAETAVDFTAAAENTVHSVVHVKTTYPAMTSNWSNDPWRDFFWGNPNSTTPQVASGSGVIISGDGYIVTNNHVVRDADKIEITLNDKRTYTAELIGKDAGTDLALLKISENNLPYCLYGNSDDVKVGQWVLAVGNPFNLTSTVTAGIVSAKGRNINILENDVLKGLPPVEAFIQTDAAVNPGNSGGALVNTSGQLIGINAAIASNTGSYTGYSFAIPVSIVRKVVNDLIEFGEVQRAFIGVSIQDIDSKLADEKKLKNLKGVYVKGISENGGASEAGIKEGDVITKVGNAAVGNVPELQEQVARFRPGDKISVTVVRGEQEKEVFVTLKNKNGNVAVVEKEKLEAVNSLGAYFEEVSPTEMKKLGIDFGVKIVKMEGGGKLRSAGIREGFIITNVDKKKISNVDELNKILENKKGGVLIEGVYPNGMRAYYAFGI